MHSCSPKSSMIPSMPKRRPGQLVTIPDGTRSLLNLSEHKWGPFLMSQKSWNCPFSRKKSLLTSPNHSTLESNGQAASPSKRSETNPPVVLAGLSLQLNLWVIDCALPKTSKIRPEFQLKTCSLAVDLPVVWDAMEASHLVPGNTSRALVSLVVMHSETIAGARLTLSPNVNTTQLESTILVVPVNRLPNASRNAILNQEGNMLKTRSTALMPTVFLTQSKPSWTKSSSTGLLKVLLQFMKISLPTNQVSTSMSQETSSEAMPLRLLVGALRMVWSIG